MSIPIQLHVMKLIFFLFLWFCLLMLFGVFFCLVGIFVCWVVFPKV